MKRNPTLNETLEALIDKHSLSEVMQALQSVCHDKAEHLRTNWQDYNSADLWDGAAENIDCAVKGDIKYV